MRRGRQGREMAGDLAQVGIGQVIHQVGHERILAPAFAEVEQLVVQVAGRLTANAREVAVVDRIAARIDARVACGAGDQALGQRIGYGLRRRMRRTGARQQQDSEQHTAMTHE